MSVLDIKNLEVSINDKKILKGLNLEIKSGEIHAVMGPNGAGKSTLASAIMGHPKYEVDGGSILLDNEEVLDMEVDERARAGLCNILQKFLVCQHQNLLNQLLMLVEKKIFH